MPGVITVVSVAEIRGIGFEGFARIGVVTAGIEVTTAGIMEVRNSTEAKIEIKAVDNFDSNLKIH